MDKRGLILVLLVVSLAVLGGCKVGNTETPPAEVDPCAALGTDDAKDTCFLDRINIDRITSIDFCDNIILDGNKEICYEDVFSNSKENLDCDVQTTEMKRDTCWRIIAIAEGKPGICGKLINLDKRDRCYLDLIKNMSWTEEINRDICENIGNEQTRSECFEIIRTKNYD